MKNSFSVFGFIFVFMFSQPILGNQDSNVIQIRNNLLTIRAKSVPLQTVLKKIADQTQIKVFVLGATDNSISADLSNVPLERGLKRIFQNYNSIFIYNSTDGIGDKPKIQSILIYPKDGEDMSNTSIQWASRTDEKTTPPEAPPPESSPYFRRDEYPEFQHDVADSSLLMEDEKTLNELSDELLREEDAETRAYAANMLGSLGDEDAMEVLIQALDDPNSEVHISAVEAMALIGSREAIPYLRSALNDSNGEVRSAATTALNEFAE